MIVPQITRSQPNVGMRTGIVATETAMFENRVPPFLPSTPAPAIWILGNKAEEPEDYLAEQSSAYLHFQSPVTQCEHCSSAVSAVLHSHFSEPRLRPTILPA